MDKRCMIVEECWLGITSQTSKNSHQLSSKFEPAQSCGESVGRQTQARVPTMSTVVNSRQTSSNIVTCRPTLVNPRQLSLPFAQLSSNLVNYHYLSPNSRQPSLTLVNLSYTVERLHVAFTIFVFQDKKIFDCICLSVTPL